MTDNNLRADAFFAERLAMVHSQIETRGISNERVLDALIRVPRHAFVPPKRWPQAYDDCPLPIGPRQTISQPYIVAFMAQALDLKGSEKILEVGSGCGYALAIMSHLCAEVRGIELVPELCRESQARLQALGYENVRTRIGDGYQGWPEEAPFDAIFLSCASPGIPPPLWSQLRDKGHFLYPKGEEFGHQELVLVTKIAEGAFAEYLESVRFVPMRRD